MNTYESLGSVVAYLQTPQFRAYPADRVVGWMLRGPRPAAQCREALNLALQRLPAPAGATVWRRSLIVARCPWMRPAWRAVCHVDDAALIGASVPDAPGLDVAIVPPTGAAWLKTELATGAGPARPGLTTEIPQRDDERWAVEGTRVVSATTGQPMIQQVLPADLTAEIAAALSAPPASAEACERARLLLQLVLPPGHEPFVWRSRVAACRVAGARPAWRYLGRVDTLIGMPRLDVVIVPVGSRWASGCR